MGWPMELPLTMIGPETIDRLVHELERPRRYRSRGDVSYDVRPQLFLPAVGARITTRHLHE